jgi:hypothetical protein
MSTGEDQTPHLGDLADVAEAEVFPQAEVSAPRPRAGRLARSTAFFSFATGLSRIAGLVREIFAASYFGVSAQMSAFTIAFQVPNLVRSLFADAAIQAAFVPVFTEKLERGDRREAFRLASNLIFVVTLVLGALTALFILIAPVLMPLFVPASDQTVADLTVSLSRVLFPILVLLGVTGMVVGVLNSYDRFGAFAISPFFWNVAIIVVLVGLAPAFPEGDEIYAYAVGVLVGTVIQLAIPLYDMRHTPYGLRRALKAPFSGVRRRRRAQGAAADAAGDDQPRADQLQPADQQHRRLFGLRAGPGGDRQGVSDLHAAAGRVLGRGGDGAVSDPVPVRGPR